MNAFAFFFIQLKIIFVFVFGAFNCWVSLGIGPVWVNFRIKNGLLEILPLVLRHLLSMNNNSQLLILLHFKLFQKFYHLREITKIISYFAVKESRLLHSMFHLLKVKVFFYYELIYSLDEMTLLDCSTCIHCLEI